MDGETMQKNFDDILNGGVRSKDFEITNEEATKFKTAMADPEFQSMLRDYMQEMQDPAQRAEQETYIAELEGQNRVPEGKEVLHPIPGFVIKTKFTRDSKDDDHEKLFVNIVTSDKLAKPYSNPSKNRPGGESWSLPVAVGPLRMENDKGGGNTTTFDVCYHPEALVRAQRLDAFRDLVALSSLERVEDAFLQATKQKMTVEKSYRILKGVTYKSGPCATMMVAKGDILGRNGAAGTEESKPTAPSSEAKEVTRNPKRERKSKADKPPSVTNVNDERTTARAPSAEPKAVDTDAGSDDKLVKAGEDESHPTTLLAEGQKRGNGGTTYKLVESGAFDIADHTSDRMRQAPVPQKLIATVTLPSNAEPTRNLDVVVALRRLTIGVAGDREEAPARYLDLALPYDVEDDSKCSAARDKAGLLKITMPVKPPARPPAPILATATEPGAGAYDGDVVDVGKETLSDEEHEGVEEKTEQKVSSPTETKQPDHSRWVEEAQPSEGFDKPWELMENVDSKACLAEEKEMKEEKGAISELPPPPPDAEDLLSEGLTEDVDGFFQRKLAEDAPFIPCSHLHRPLDGYSFKTDLMGCGYYREDKDKKVPPVEWNETVKTMCGVVSVPNIVDASVRYVFMGDQVGLSFDARVPGEAGKEGIERYRVELELSGGVAVEKCSHNTAEDNLAFKIVKEPEGEWGSLPTLSVVTKLGVALNNVLGSAAAAAGLPVEEMVTDAAAGVGGKEEGGLAPGHGGLGSAGVGTGGGAIPPMDFGSLAFELD